MRKALVAGIVGLGLLVGCGGSNSPESFIGPSGQVLETVKCKSSPKQCFAQANKSCSGSYQVVSSESHAGGILADFIPGPVTWYGMTYQCGQSDGKNPTFPFQGGTYTPAPVIYVPPANNKVIVNNY
tara:strand:- start:37 stop:417 length:381 start_codon:yes stop_codon:yes gene_type:complete